MFVSFEEIQGYIEECEQKLLDFENAKLWSKVCLPITGTTETQKSYQGKNVFKYVQIMLLKSSELFMADAPPPDWVWKKTL